MGSRGLWKTRGVGGKHRARGLRGKHKPSLLSSRYLVHNGCQADYGKLKITSKQKTISQISRGWDNILWTLTLGC